MEENFRARHKLTRKTLKVDSPEDWLAVLRAIKEMLTTADIEERRQIGIAIIGIGQTIDLPDSQLMEFFEVSRADLEKAVPPAFLKARGLFLCMMTCPQLSPVCKSFHNAWTSCLTH